MQLLESPLSEAINSLMATPVAHESLDAQLAFLGGQLLARSKSYVRNRRIKNPSFRAPSIKGLIDFTNRHNCWHFTTAEVTSKIVVPLTLGRGFINRFVELEELEGCCDAADVFVSHTWSGNWGLLICALASSYADHDAVHCFIDIFANMQPPEPGALPEKYLEDIKQELQSDLASMAEVIRSTKLGTLVVVDSAGAPETSPIRRIWCRWEMWRTVKSQRVLSMAFGTVDKSGSGLREFIVEDPGFMDDQSRFKLFYDKVDILECGATNLDDKTKILSDIKENTTFKELDSTVQIALCTACVTLQLKSFQAAYNGDVELLRKTIDDMDHPDWKGKVCLPPDTPPDTPLHTLAKIAPHT